MNCYQQQYGVLAGVPTATLQQWLSDAQAAYAALMTGRREISVGYDGKSVTYSQTEIGQLQAWIMTLMSALGMVCRARRPMIPFFR
jgi:gpW